MDPGKALIDIYAGGEDTNCILKGKGYASILSEKYEPRQKIQQAHCTILYAVSI